MQSSDHFKKTIAEYLKLRAFKYPLFKEKLKNPSKKIDDCITYILNQVKTSGKVGFTDDEIFGMAIHYYDEDNLDVGPLVNVKVVVNHAVSLSESEIKSIKEKAKQKVFEEEKERLQKKSKKISSTKIKTEETLF